MFGYAIRADTLVTAVAQLPLRFTHVPDVDGLAPDSASWLVAYRLQLHTRLVTLVCGLPHAGYPRLAHTRTHTTLRLCTPALPVTTADSTQLHRAFTPVWFCRLPVAVATTPVAYPGWFRTITVIYRTHTRFNGWLRWLRFTFTHAVLDGCGYGCADWCRSALPGVGSRVGLRAAHIPVLRYTHTTHGYRWAPLLRLVAYIAGCLCSCLIGYVAHWLRFTYGFCTRLQHRAHLLVIVLRFAGGYGYDCYYGFTVGFCGYPLLRYGCRADCSWLRARWTRRILRVTALITPNTTFVTTRLVSFTVLPHGRCRLLDVLTALLVQFPVWITFTHTWFHAAQLLQLIPQRAPGTHTVAVTHYARGLNRRVHGCTLRLRYGYACGLRPARLYGLPHGCVTLPRFPVALRRHYPARFTRLRFYGSRVYRARGITVDLDVAVYLVPCGGLQLNYVCCSSTSRWLFARTRLHSWLL